MATLDVAVATFKTARGKNYVKLCDFGRACKDEKLKNGHFWTHLATFCPLLEGKCGHENGRFWVILRPFWSKIGCF